MSDRYRLVFYYNSSVRWIVDDKQEVAACIKDGATKISALSYSSPIEVYKPTPMSYGDIHFYLRIDPAKREELEEVARSLLKLTDIYGLELGAIKVYGPLLCASSEMMVLHFVIPEPIFQGEIGFQSRSSIDTQLLLEIFGDEHFKRCQRDYLNVEGVQVQMLPLNGHMGGVVDPLTEITEPEKWVSEPYLSRYKSIAPSTELKCSLLAARYLWFPEDASKYLAENVRRKDVGMLSRCKIIDQAMKYWECLAEVEKDLLLQNIRGVMFGENKPFNGIPIGFSCQNIKQYLGSVFGFLSCHEYCPVSSPLAFLVHRDIDSDMQLTANGLFPNDIDIRDEALASAIWYGGLAFDDSGEDDDLYLHIVDTCGACQQIVMSYKDVDSPWLFQVLKEYGAILPAAKRDKGRIRRNIYSVIKGVGREVVREAGWKNKGCNNQVFIFPRGGSLPCPSRYMFKTQKLIGVKNVGCAAASVLETKKVKNWQIVHSVAYRVTYLSFFLSLLETPPICFHFYCRDENIRKAFMSIIEYDWQMYFPKVFWKAKSALRNRKELLRGSRHSFICLGDMIQNDLEITQEAVRKIIRKAKHETVTIFSVGEVSLATSSKAESPHDVFIDDGQLMAINIDISEWGELVAASYEVQLTHAQIVLSGIHEGKLDSYRNEEKFLWDKSAGKGESKVLGYLSILKLVLEDINLSSSTPDIGFITFGMSDVVQKIIKNFKQGNSGVVYQETMENIMNGICSDSFAGLSLNYPVVESEGCECLFVPSADLKKMAGVEKGYRAFLNWLSEKDFFVDVGGQSAGVRYYKKEKRPVRGYYLNIATLLNMHAFYARK